MANKTALILSLLLFLSACTSKQTPSVFQVYQKTTLPFGFDDSTTFLQAWKKLEAKGFEKQGGKGEDRLDFGCSKTGLSFSGVEMQYCRLWFYKGHILNISFEGKPIGTASDELDKLKALKKYLDNEGLKATGDEFGSVTVGRDLMDKNIVTFSGNPIDINIYSGYTNGFTVDDHTYDKGFVPCIVYWNNPVLKQQQLDDAAAQKEKDKNTKDLLK